jgi:2'-5' RNA ligase
MKRLFAAIHIIPGKEFLELYASLMRGLRFAEIKWVKPQNLHITLKFFGETYPDRIPDINRVLKEISISHKPFSFTIGGTGIFGASYNPKVIWFGIDNATELISLGKDVLSAVEEIGWERDRQNFRPHLTVGRVKNANDKQLFQKMIDEHNKAFIQEVSVIEFRLYESLLHRDGPVYKVLENFKLGNGSKL